MLFYSQTSRAGNQHRAERLGLSSAQTTKSNGQLSTKAEAYGHNDTHNKLIKVSLKKKIIIVKEGTTLHQLKGQLHTVMITSKVSVWGKLPLSHFSAIFN